MSGGNARQVDRDLKALIRAAANHAGMDEPASLVRVQTARGRKMLRFGETGKKTGLTATSSDRERIFLVCECGQIFKAQAPEGKMLSSTSIADAQCWRSQHTGRSHKISGVWDYSIAGKR